MMNWKREKERLISIRDSYQECIGFTQNYIVSYISNISTNSIYNH